MACCCAAQECLLSGSRFVGLSCQADAHILSCVLHSGRGVAMTDRSR